MDGITTASDQTSDPRESTRVTKIVEAANQEFNATGTLPFSLASVAERAEVSRSLIYTHFQDQQALTNAVLAQHRAVVADRALELISQSEDFKSAALDLSEYFFTHYLQHGLILALATQDDFSRPSLDQDMRRFIRVGLRKLSGLAVEQFSMSHREAIATVLMLSVIPEQAARLTRSGRVSENTSRAMQRRVMLLALDTLRSDA